MNQGCVVQSREQLIQQIKTALDANPDEQFVFVMHHPVEARGPHGGYYTFRDHMFPLSKVVKWLYLPLPVIGSIYPWYRTVIGHPQDLQHKAYKSLQTALYDVIGDRKELDVLGSHISPYTYPIAIDLLERGLVDVKDIVTRTDLMNSMKASASPPRGPIQ